MFRYLMIIIGTYIIYGIIYKFTKKKKPFRRAFLIMLIGFLVLLAVDLVGIYTGVYLPVSMLSVTISMCLGVPGVAGMIVLCWLL